MPRPTSHLVLQNLAAHLLSGRDGLDWRMESFTLAESVGIRPALTAEAQVMGYSVRLCARAWGTSFRIALRVSFGLGEPTSSDGRHAPPERQREPNTVTPSVVLAWDTVTDIALRGAWSKQITELFDAAKTDLLAAGRRLEEFLAARATQRSYPSTAPP